ncbi:hypothetical protein HBI57_054820 [Parastagonospora nodorum]|nr:hypothetical protein HBI57_054820 [Parastagonospora nodorum]KAH6478424.1 hypothetical protein HBI58_091120 [Parastagonospora nodorum]
MARCSLCHDLVRRDEDDARLAFNFTPQELVRSAFYKHCDSCLVILEGLRQSEKPDWSWQRDIRRVYARCHDKSRSSFQDTLRLEIYFVDDRPKLDLEYYSLRPHRWKSIQPRTSISGHPLSTQAVDWVSGFLKQCKLKHVSCRQAARPLLPKRVLLLNSDNGENITARLFEPINQRSPYVSLSHCWGKRQNCITTRKNIAKRIAGVPWKQIPQTFREAMQLTIKLGVRYIWIDSLCIVQDDAEDWEVQSALMSEIYQNAVLTIAATSSSGDNEGSSKRIGNRAPDIEVALPEDVGTCRIGVRRPLDHFDVQTAGGLLDHFPLLTRGWAFQERLLSPRVLHICEFELVWECREASRCECGGVSQEKSPGGAYHHAVRAQEKEQHKIARLNNAVRMEAMRLARNDDVQRPSDDPETELPPPYEEAISRASTEDSITSAIVYGLKISDDDIFAFDVASNVPFHAAITPPVNEEDTQDCPELVFHFHRIVEQYSTLKWTKPSDRLVAFSGLCKRVQHLRNNYLAGLWSDSIGYDLIWRVETINLNTADNGARSPEYRGPTWSWVSVDSPISYWTDIINFRDESVAIYRAYYTAAGSHPDNIAMAVTVPGANPFGSVASAILTIEASSNIGVLRYTYDPHWLGGAGKHDPVRYKIEVSIARGDAIESHEIPFEADYSLGAEGESHVPADSEVVLLLIHPQVCLVLRPAQRVVAPVVVNGGPAWERIGHARIPEAFVNYYSIDWMSGSEVRKFHIV